MSRRSCLRLFQLTTAGTSPSIQQSFDIGSVGTDLAFPSIALDSAGNAFLGFSGSSSGMYPSFLTSLLPVGGGPGDGESLAILTSGLGLYDDCAPTCTLSPSNNNRWGDYGGAAVDPVNPAFVWVAGEYSASGTNPLDWGTVLAEVSLVTLPTSTASPTVTTTPTPPGTIPETATPTPTAGGTGSPTQTATEVGTSPIPTFTPSATATPVWLDVPVGQATVVSTSAGSLPVTISIPSGDAIAKIAVSLPNSSFAQIYTIDNGSPRLLTTSISQPEHGFYVAIASTDHLSPFVIFAPPARAPLPRSYLPVIVQGLSNSGW